MSGELQKLELKVRRGSTVRLPIRVMTGELAWREISAISQTAPVRVTVPLHDMPSLWPCGIVGVQGMRQMNSPLPLDIKSFRSGIVIDENTIEFNEINAAVWPAYTMGGHLAYYKPLDLSEFTEARMALKASVDATEKLAEYTSTSGQLVISSANDMLELRLSDVNTKALLLAKYVFDIELVKADLSVRAICSADSTITVTPEITTE